MSQSSHFNLSQARSYLEQEMQDESLPADSIILLGEAIAIIDELKETVDNEDEA